MKNLIILQENSGEVGNFQSEIQDANLRNLVTSFIDGLAENFESIKSSLQMFGYYDQIINLTDTRCTKVNLLSEMIRQSTNGYVFDLLIMGHGSRDTLMLHGSETLTGSGIRNLLREARQHHARLNFSLRMVYMCNCYGGSLLNAWQSIGAKVALGCNNINYMPEPQITYFFNDFVKNGFSVTEANNRSFAASNTIWAVSGLTASNRNGSKLTVLGNGDLRFEGRRLAVNEAITRNIYANNAFNHTNILLLQGERYQFEVRASDKWKTGSREVNANGYKRGIFDVPRQPSYNMMALVGEIFNDNRNALSYTGTHFKIGTRKDWRVERSGYLVCHANDGLPFYGDNAGMVQLSIKRLR